MTGLQTTSKKIENTNTYDNQLHASSGFVSFQLDTTRSNITPSLAFHIVILELARWMFEEHFHA